MTQRQRDLVERSLSGLSASDKLELVERLVREIRVAGTVDRGEPVARDRPMTEEEFKEHLIEIGLMTSLPLPPDPTPRPEFRPIVIEGEPLSETIMRERR